LHASILSPANAHATGPLPWSATSLLLLLPLSLTWCKNWPRRWSRAWKYNWGLRRMVTWWTSRN
jgi:hypothetical protein